MQTFSETSIAERFISRSSLIYVQEGDRHVKALKLKVGDQNTSRPNTVVSDLWKFELISKAWQSPRIWSCRCRACTWGSWRTHRRLPLSLAWTLTWNLAPPSPSTTVQVFQFLMTTFNSKSLSTELRYMHLYWPKSGTFNGSNLTFLFKSPSLFNNWFCFVLTAQSSSLCTCSRWRDANSCHLATTSSFTFTFNLTEDCVFHLNLMQYTFNHFYSLSRGKERFAILAKCSWL